MNMKLRMVAGAKRRTAAFSLIELVVAISVLLVTFVSIFGTMTMGLSITQLSRENLRATQIMLDKMEGVRLYNWTQLNDPTFLKSAFTNWFFETNNIGTGVATGNGVQYVGQVSVSNCPVSTSYSSNNLRSVSVSINWASGGISRTRTMTTFVSQQGLQNYIYNN